jgi:hypothetical protein
MKKFVLGLSFLALVGVFVYAASLPSCISITKTATSITARNTSKGKNAQTVTFQLGVDIQYEGMGSNGRQCVPADFELAPGKTSDPWYPPKGARILTYSVDNCVSRTDESELW